MILLVILRKIKSLLCCIVSLLGKCFCCLRRKHNDDELPITISTHTGNTAEVKKTIEDWDSWQEGPSSVMSQGKVLTSMEQQINQYRINQQRKLSDPPEEPNYFQDLAPEIKQKRQVVILARPEEEQLVSNRISLSLTEPHLEGSELLEWNDEEPGWEEEAEDDLAVDAAIREQRANLRQAKKNERLKKKAQKELNKQNIKCTGQKIAMKLS